MALAILDDRDSVRHGSVPGEWSMDKAVRIHAARYGRHDFVKAALLVPHSDLPPGPSAVRHDDLHRAPDMDRTAPGNRRTRMQMDRQPDLLAFYTRFDNW